MNKKGAVGDQLTIFVFLFLMIIIGGGIAIGVFLFYGGGYDYRGADAELLNYKIRNCLLENNLDDEFIDNDRFFRTCKLNKDVVVNFNIVKICLVKEGEDCANSDVKGEFVSGSNFNICRIQETKSNKSFPVCSVMKIEKGENEYEIIVGSKKVSRRVQG